MIRVALADDHRLFLDGLAEGLEAVPDLTVVATAGDGASLLDELRGSDPDVLLVDLEMPGLDGLQVLRALPKPLPTIVVTMYAGEEQRRDAKAAGAAGFLSKSTALPEVAAAIRAVAAGLRLIDASPPFTMLEEYREPALGPGVAALTRRERELLALLAKGMTSTDEIADRLFISHKTVKNHLASIFEKLGVSDRTQAAIVAIRLGLVAK